MSYQILLATVDEIKGGVSEVHALSSTQVKNEFKEMMMECGEVAILLENLTVEKRNRFSKKHIVDHGSSVLLDLYNISQTIFSELLIYAGFSSVQIQEITQACKESLSSSEKTICNLFEANALETSLLKYPPNKSLLAYRQSAKSTADENVFDSFVSYLISEGIPSVVLEKIARLDFYQKDLLFRDLQDYRFNEIYQNFVETGSMKQVDIKYCKNKITKSLLKHFNQFPYQCLEKDGYPLVMKSEKFFDEDFLEKRSPATYFDAWGVIDTVLHVYCVTTQSNFQNQDVQAVKFGYGILNGIKKGTLKDVSDFKITAVCSTILSDEHENARIFNEQVKVLLNSKKISFLDYNALKFSPVDKEILNIISTTPEDLYNQLKGRLSIGFHSDKSPSVMLKDLENQIISSIQRLEKSIFVMGEIIKNNPTLDLIDGAIGAYAVELDQSFKLAYDASTLYCPGNGEIDEILNRVEEGLSNIRDTLVQSNSSFADSVSLAISRPAHIIKISKARKEKYIEVQKAIDNGSVTFNEQLRLTTVSHGLSIRGVHGASVRSQVLTGHYNKGSISQSLLVDTIMAQIELIVEKQQKSIHGTWSQHSCKALIKGINQANAKGFDLTQVVDVLNKTPELKEKIKNQCNVGNGSKMQM